MPTCVHQPLCFHLVHLRLGTRILMCAVGLLPGVTALYSGISAGLLRQATYTTARLGIFQELNKLALERNEGKALPLAAKAGLGLTAGGLGAFVGTPADLTLIRMQSGKQPLLASHAFSCPPLQGSVSLHPSPLFFYWASLHIDRPPLAAALAPNAPCVSCPAGVRLREQS